MGFFDFLQRDPEAVAARQAGRTARQRVRQRQKTARQAARFGNAADRREAGNPGLNALIDGAIAFHGQSNASAEKFFGVFPGQTSGGALSSFGLGAPPGAPGGGADVVVLLGIGLLAGGLIFAVTR